MSKKRSIILSLLTICVLLFITQSTIAGTDWREEQKKMFSQIPVKPGDVIDKTNWEKAKGLVPESVLNWVKKGEWTLKIAEFKYDFDYTKKFYAVSSENKSRYGLGEKKEVIDLKTGKFPMFISGLPFPNVDTKTDPDGPTKFMHNSNLCTQMNGSYDNFGEPKKGALQWIGSKGYERGVGFTMQKFYYWNRPDGERPNPNNYMWTTGLLTTWPYDLTGTATLYVRYLDGRDDMVYAYVPSIRRVKRLSGANRSDPQMGSDQCMDDTDGFSGHVESMKWTYVGEKVVLCPKWEDDMKSPRVLKKNSIGAWECYIPEGQRFGWEEPDWQGAPWAFSNATWAPRKVVILKAEPIDPYYAYGMLELYMDKKTRLAIYNIKYNRAGEFWKTLINEHPMTHIPDPKYAATANSFNLNGAMIVLDEKTHHASSTPVDETHQLADSPRVHPRSHSPQAMRTWTK